MEIQEICEVQQRAMFRVHAKTLYKSCDIPYFPMPDTRKYQKLSKSMGILQNPWKYCKNHENDAEIMENCENVTPVQRAGGSGITKLMQTSGK